MNKQEQQVMQALLQSYADGIPLNLWPSGMNQEQKEFCLEQMVEMGFFDQGKEEILKQYSGSCSPPTRLLALYFVRVLEMEIKYKPATIRYSERQ